MHVHLRWSCGGGSIRHRRGAGSSFLAATAALWTRLLFPYYVMVMKHILQTAAAALNIYQKIFRIPPFLSRGVHLHLL